MFHEHATAMTRRAFLKGSGALGLGGALALTSGVRLAFARPGAERRGDMLVCVFLRGGLDALSAVVPYQEADYFERRPSIAVPATRVIDLDGQFGLHPALTPLAEIFQARELAIVHAVGHPNLSRSHFRGQLDWERALGSGGWIARHLTTTSAERPDSDLRALASAPAPPFSLRSTPSALSVSTLENFVLDAYPEGHQDLARASLLQLYGAASGLAGELSEKAHQTFGLLGSLQQVAAQPYTPRAGVSYPETSFGQALRQTAQLIRSDVGIGLEAACVDAQGFDTHVAMGTWDSGTMRLLLEDLGASLAAFYADLEDFRQDLTMVVMSEFGRQVHENGGGGCDHGTGGCMFVLGGGIRGGVYASWPGLHDPALAPGMGLAVTTDFRDVLAEVVLHRLKNPNLGAVLPGHTVTPLGLAIPRV